MSSAPSNTLYLHVRCPYGDYEDWIALQGRADPLEHVLGAPFAFECPTHGVQMEFPLEGSEKKPALASPTAAPSARPSVARKRVRSSERRAFHVPVFVYGWSKSTNSFHEDTVTVMFNSSGALVRLMTPVSMGENLFVVNKFTREEQQVRVVYLEPHPAGGSSVGLAFPQPVPLFWRKTRCGARTPESFRVVVRGKDRNGNPFAQSSSTLDVSEEGARLDDLSYLTAPGEVIEVKRRWHGKARFRVAWIGQVGSFEANHIGICTLEGKLPWRVRYKEPRAKALKKS